MPRVAIFIVFMSLNYSLSFSNSPDNAEASKDQMKPFHAAVPLSGHLLNGHHDLLHKQAPYLKNEDSSIASHEEYLRNLEREDISDDEIDHDSKQRHIHGYPSSGMPLRQFNDDEDEAFEGEGHFEGQGSEDNAKVAVAVSREDVMPMLMMRAVQEKLEAECKGRSSPPEGSVKQVVCAEHEVQMPKLKREDSSKGSVGGLGEEEESGEVCEQKDDSMSDTEVSQRQEQGMES